MENGWHTRRTRTIARSNALGVGEVDTIPQGCDRLSKLNTAGVRNCERGSANISRRTQRQVSVNLLARVADPPPQPNAMPAIHQPPRNAMPATKQPRLPRPALHQTHQPLCRTRLPLSRRPWARSTPRSTWSRCPSRRPTSLVRPTAGTPPSAPLLATHRRSTHTHTQTHNTPPAMPHDASVRPPPPLSLVAPRGSLRILIRIRILCFLRVSFLQTWRRRGHPPGCER